MPPRTCEEMTIPSSLFDYKTKSSSKEESNGKAGIVKAERNGIAKEKIESISPRRKIKQVMSSEK